jgi:methyl-accepting chemotaxis protein
LNKGLLIASIATPLVHATLFLAPGPGWARLGAVVAVDLAVAAVAAKQFRLTRETARRAASAPAAAIVPPPPDLVAVTAVEAERAAAAAAATAAAARLGEIGELARASLDAGVSLSEELRRLGRSEAEYSALTAALAEARAGSELLKENTDKIFGIANNLANSAEQAFNLAHEVEGRAASMAGELTASLSETDALLAESKRISDILEIVADISSTTNILSFNAFIVAANAGAAGKPFAVVAKEMRKLSEGTEKSLKDIASILHTIQDEVKAVSDRIRSVNAGVKDEKESLVSVAGELQGVMLANEVVRTVSSLCAQKSAEGLERIRSMESMAGSAARGLDSGQALARADSLAASLKDVVDLAKK